MKFKISEFFWFIYSFLNIKTYSFIPKYETSRCLFYSYFFSTSTDYLFIYICPKVLKRIGWNVFLLLLFFIPS